MPAHLPRALAALAALALVALATALAGCGEKSEPELTGAASTTSTTPAGGFRIRGRWAGTLEQKHLGAFNVEATINAPPGNRPGKVRYGGINCGGTWRYLGRSEGAYRYREVIDSGAGETCKGSGTVTLAPASGGQLDYEFRGGGVFSRGELERPG